MNQLLEDLAREEFDEGRPMLTALVVRQSDGRPGNGFAAIALDLYGKNVEWESCCDTVTAYYSEHQPE